MQEREIKKARKALGKTIWAYRMEMGISQEKLAEIADVHRNYIGKIERGEQNVSINSLLQLAEALKRPLSEILADAGL